MVSGKILKSSFTDSLDIIDFCSLEISEDFNMVANDVLVNCVGHEHCSRDDETFVSEVDVLRTFVKNLCWTLNNKMKLRDVF